MTMPTITKSTSVKLGSRKQALSELATYQKRSVHSLILEAVDKHIEQEQERIQYEQNAIRSYQRFQETGLHTTIEAMQEWARSLNTSNPKPLPPCHK